MKKVKGDNDGFVGYHHMSIEYTASPSPQSPIYPRTIEGIEAQEDQKINRQWNNNQLNEQTPS